jgi:hypothetical protein
VTRYEELSERAAKVGLYVRTYSPGDGVTRYRFFGDPANTYFGPDNGVHTALGIGAAHAFVDAFAVGRITQLEVDKTVNS